MLRRVLNCLPADAVLAGFLCLVLVVQGLAAAASYRGHLGPMPLNGATQVNIAGHGLATATLDGDMLTVSGSFEGLKTAATDAHLFQSMWIGVPGHAIFDLTVSQATSGKVEGKLKLDADQVAALKSGQLYVQINSQKAPDGNLWGWLLPDHEVVGEDVPQKGPWFVPRIAVKTK
jgi:CHRD domain